MMTAVTRRFSLPPKQELSGNTVSRVLVPEFRKLTTCTALLLSTFVLMACSSPYDRGVADGDAEYHNELSAEQQAEARRMVGSKFQQGLAEYQLNVGDVIEVLFLLGADVEIDEYRIHVGDLLGIDFFYHSEMSRQLRVRPDGRITLPLKGEIMAAGKTPMELAGAIKQMFSSTYRDPQITVTVEELTSAIDEFSAALDGFSLDGGRSRKFQVAPDGQIYPPFIPPVQAAGKTVAEVQSLISVAYDQKYAGLEVSLQLTELKGNRVFVFGEVPAPGAYSIQGPQTVLQAVAQAGGWLPTAAKNDVRVVYWDENLEARVRSVDIEAVAKSGVVSQELLLSSNSTVYVPPSGITTANRFVDQYIRQLFLFNGTSLSVTYEQNYPDTNN